ncbi:hypothetical protein J4423_02505 [Candidatus Pacearchaeota archaeon]|nr:hypothetical protein [Candidatus Pacearchaeota archaeon]
MGSVNISIKDEVYSFLKSLKTRDESFSDVIWKFKEKKAFNGKMLVEFRHKYGEIIKNIDTKDMEERMKEFREEVEERFEETAKYMEESRKK